MCRSMASVAVLMGAPLLALAAFDLGFGNDSDLTHFVTRPEIKAPLFEVKIHNPEKVTGGYWFVAPYANVQQESHPSKYYQACSSGPLIYDGKGELIWSGACAVKNQNTCDFRAWQVNDTYLLSGLLMRGLYEWAGHGFVMDSSYQTQDLVLPPPPVNHFNMHEFNLIDNGRSALHVVSKPVLVDITDRDADYNTAWVLDMGFRETDVMTGQTKFLWWAQEQSHVSTNESHVRMKNILGPPPSSWDYFHANSVDKNDDGDYIFNGRHTDTIYKVSGQDGSILWRLGGHESSFVLEPGFNFSRQHDARFYDRREGHELITLLDNASDLNSKSATTSSALIVDLDHTTTPPTARVAQRILRPDGRLTRSRGNHQRLPGGHAFVCWSDNAYLSEHESNGDMVMETRFSSRRFTTYRAYKLNFTATPSEPPTVKAFAYGTSPEKASTVIYISWNGATEVASYRFSGQQGGIPIHLGSVRMTGFETTFTVDGVLDTVEAEALDDKGSILGSSAVSGVVIPEQLTLSLVHKVLAPTPSPQTSPIRDGPVMSSSVSVEVRPLYSLFPIAVGMIILTGIWRVFARRVAARRRLKVTPTPMIIGGEVA